MDILKKAEELLFTNVPSIVDFPAARSRGSLNDYYSEGIYWHPDKARINGYPYIRKDGIVNSRAFTSHKKLLECLKRNTAILYKAYESTEDRRFISKLEEILRSFFIDEKTRMNPNLKYAEAVPGLFDGRRIGIVDSLKLLEIPKMVMALDRKGVIDSEIRNGVGAWFEDYVSWLESIDDIESDPGSCYSSAYYLQLAAYSGISR